MASNFDFSMEHIAIALIFLVIGIFIGKAKRKYQLNSGEARLHDALKKTFCDESYHFLNNVTLPFDSGTTQIDHILISTKGVFVVETKDYSGWIFGGRDDKKWTQVIFHKKSRFQNPIRQNYKHILAVRRLLDFLPTENIISSVVFVGDTEIKTEIPGEVFYPSGFIEFVREKPEVISNNRVAFSVGRLECARYQISRKTDIEHHNYLISKYGES